MPQRNTTAVGDVYSPRQREMSSSTVPVEPLTAWVEGWNRTMTNMYETWMQAVQTSWEPYLAKPAHSGTASREHRHECSCEDHKHECNCDQGCTCRCCVGDVDLVINSRLGERRVVPIVIENSSRRDRDVELDLSDWTPRGGQANAQVTGGLINPLKFTLSACAEQTLTLVVTSAGTDAANNPGKLDTNLDQAGNRLGDVDLCQVFTADLRVKGCDIRPIRIAVTLLPRGCEPFEINCRCGCC